MAVAHMLITHILPAHLRATRMELTYMMVSILRTMVAMTLMLSSDILLRIRVKLGPATHMVTPVLGLHLDMPNCTVIMAMICSTLTNGHMQPTSGYHQESTSIWLTVT